MQENFYKEKLYPVQDKVLQILNSSSNNFYLTGGTALSRFYLNHRYSDDLDFFVNDDPSFRGQIQSVQNELAKSFNTTVIKNEERFAMFLIQAGEVKLKLEFINDVPFYLGEIKSFELFSRVDNILNILSNKITAVSDRNEPKDFADIIFIFNNTKVDWELIFSSADSKAAGIFPPVIAKRIEEFKLDNLKILNWIKIPDYSALEIIKGKLIKSIMGIE